MVSTAGFRGWGVQGGRGLRWELNDALAMPWIRLWRGMGYGPDLIAKLLDIEGVQPPRSRWSANAVRRIGERRGITWRGRRSFVREGIEAGRGLRPVNRCPAPLPKRGPRRETRERRQYSS